MTMKLRYVLIVAYSARLKKCLQRSKKKKVPWGIVTNKPRYLAEQLLMQMQLDSRCAVLVCPDDV